MKENKWNININITSIIYFIITICLLTKGYSEDSIQLLITSGLFAIASIERSDI